MTTYEAQFVEKINTIKGTFQQMLIAINKYIAETDGMENHMRLQQSIKFNADLKTIDPNIKLLIQYGTAELPLKQIMAVLDIIEEIKNTLTGLAVMLASPAIEASIIRNMSRSYSENLRLYGKEVGRYNSMIYTQYIDIMNIMKQFGETFTRMLTIDELIKIYTYPNRSGLSTLLYVGALVHHEDKSRALETLMFVKNYSFGVSPESKESMMTDTMMLSEYHPLQVMSYYPLVQTNVPDQSGVNIAFGSMAIPEKYEKKHVFYSRPETADDLVIGFTDPININLPQTNVHTQYKLDRLIDRKVIGTFGPVATVATGLNYRLVDRLRTIETAEYKKAEMPTRVTEYSPNIGTVAIISGDETKFIHNPHGESVPWSPFAGSSHLTSAYLEEKAIIVCESIREGKAEGWSVDIQHNFEEAIQNGTHTIRACLPNIIITTLVNELEKAYDATPPATLKEFNELVVPEAYTPDIYICSAISRIAFLAIDHQSELWYSRRQSMSIPYKTIARELHLTHAIQAMDTAHGLWFNMKKEVYGSDEQFTLLPEQRKLALFKSFKDIVHKVLKENPMICVYPTFKGFGISNAFPRTSNMLDN